MKRRVSQLSVHFDTIQAICPFDCGKLLAGDHSRITRQDEYSNSQPAEDTQSLGGA